MIACKHTSRGSISRRVRVGTGDTLSGGDAPRLLVLLTMFQQHLNFQSTTRCPSGTEALWGMQRS